MPRRVGNACGICPAVKAASRGRDSARPANGYRPRNWQTARASPDLLGSFVRQDPCSAATIHQGVTTVPGSDRIEWAVPLLSTTASPPVEPCGSNIPNYVWSTSCPVRARYQMGQWGGGRQGRQGRQAVPHQRHTASGSRRLAPLMRSGGVANGAFWRPFLWVWWWLAMAEHCTFTARAVVLAWSALRAIAR